MQSDLGLRVLFLLLEHERQWYEKKRSNPWIGVSEISDELGLSESDAHMLGDLLSRKGWLQEDAGVRGLYAITDEGRAQIGAIENYVLGVAAPTSLKDKERHRLELMNVLYRLTNGDETKRVDLREAGKHLGIADQDVQIALQWLTGEGLIRPFVLGVNYHITHQGVIEVEQLQKQPGKPTEHLPPMTILVNLGTITNSPIQAGNIGSKQDTTIEQSLRE